MRYDDDYEYGSRSSRNGSSRRSSSSRSSGRDYDRDYRNYRDDFGRSYDRYTDRSRYADRYSDRYNTRSGREFYDDFDRSDWERTAPNWEDHGSGGSRKKRTSASSGSSSSRRSRPADHNRDRDRRSYDRDRDRRGSQGRRHYDDYDRDRRRSSGQRRNSGGSRRRSALQFLPIVIGLVVIVLAFLVIRNMLGAGSDYSIQMATSNIVAGETAEATLVGKDNAALAESTQVTWTSQDNNVAEVSGTGPTAEITGVALGNATIVATMNGETVATQTVTVVDTAPGVLAIRVTEDEVTIRSGETYTIDATVEMEEGLPAASIDWSSNNTAVATVSEDGTITGRDVGNAIIKGVAGEKTVEIAVEVVENPNSDTHDPAQDVGQEPEEGADTGTTDTEGTGTTTGGTTDTGTTGGTGGSTDTGDTGTTGGTTDTGETGTTGGTTDTGDTGTTEGAGTGEE